MRHHNTLLHGLLQFLPWSRFDALVDEHGSDRRVPTEEVLTTSCRGRIAWSCR